MSQLQRKIQDEPIATAEAPPRNLLLLGVAGGAAFSSIAYELLMATYASFLWGSTVFQYSVIVSMMMLSMGIGSLLCGGIQRLELQRLVQIELVLGALALLAVPLLYTTFALKGPSLFISSLFVVSMGVLLGMEIPLLSRLLPGSGSLSKILVADYVGGFLAGLFFPRWILPKLGFFASGALFSLVNTGLALLLLTTYGLNKPQQTGSFSIQKKSLWLAGAGVLLVLGLSSLLLGPMIQEGLEWKFYRIVGMP